MSALIIYFISPLWVIKNDLLKLRCLILQKESNIKSNSYGRFQDNRKQSPPTQCNH
ncbi:hypothetical protein C0J52_12686 [Blattella germanica]|nr:hypothetical protein C0J52_12686 [Blattella germanica]